MSDAAIAQPPETKKEKKLRVSLEANFKLSFLGEVHEINK